MENAGSRPHETGLNSIVAGNDSVLKDLFLTANRGQKHLVAFCARVYKSFSLGDLGDSIYI